ncbi:uncharacterized protein LOC106178556 [Lingula anatina]|uniref:Uncharacterized protein LOC106178556 n=1 Tax=Lingula anatina TaxID=7574 RepID=A0A1S3K488_LINAN|nr:uncharacterized protein LOC106178556 [Lingula anatina]|eukprot:XP_013417229.1 uncharacterized protein LOC106178556 [Lingula anatina]
MSTNYDEVCDNMLLQLYERVRYVKDKSIHLSLDANQRMMIKLSWNAFVAGDPSNRGMQMFLKMFSMQPKTQSVFEFARGSSAAQMQNSTRIIFHVTRVVKYITKVVENLESLEDMAPVLRRLGGRHGTSGYNVPTDYFPHLGVAMRELMKAHIGNWTKQHDQLWDTLYTWIVARMREGQATYGGKR